MINQVLLKKVSTIIVALWPVSNGALASEEIYDRLLSTGENVPENALDEIYTFLKKKGLIDGKRPFNAEAYKTHGSMLITWVSQSL